MQLANRGRHGCCALLTEPEAAGVERALIPGTRVLIGRDGAELHDALCACAVRLRTQVHQHQVVVSATWRRNYYQMSSQETVARRPPSSPTFPSSNGFQDVPCENCIETVINKLIKSKQDVPCHKISVTIGAMLQGLWFEAMETPNDKCVGKNAGVTRVSKYPDTREISE